MIKPKIVNFTKAVPGAEDNVNKEIFIVDLAKPVGKGEFGK